MKRLTVSLVVLSLAAFAGCGNKGQPGGPGAVTDNSNRAVGTADNAFALETPLMSTKIHQGETKEVTISMSRGKNFAQDVVIRFANVPQGITITPASPTLLNGDKETKVNISAADDAAVDDVKVEVVGHPATGPDAKSELKLTIAKKS